MSIELNNPTMRLFFSYTEDEREQFKNAAKRVGTKVYYAKHEDNKIVWTLIDDPSWSVHRAYKIQFDKYVYFKNRVNSGYHIVFKFIPTPSGCMFVEAVGIHYTPHETRLYFNNDGGKGEVCIDSVGKGNSASNIIHYEVTQIDENEYNTCCKNLQTPVQTPVRKYFKHTTSNAIFKFTTKDNKAVLTETWGINENINFNAGEYSYFPKLNNIEVIVVDIYDDKVKPPSHTWGFRVTEITSDEYEKCRKILSEEAMDKQAEKMFPYISLKEKKNIEDVEQKLSKYPVQVMNRLSFVLPNPIRSFDLTEALNFKDFAYYAYEGGRTSHLPRIEILEGTAIYPKYVVFYNGKV